MVEEYITLFIFLVAGCIFVGGGLFTARLIRPNRPSEQKNTTYECGEEPVNNSWGNYNIRFYLVGLIFLIFEAEIIFLFPWATVYSDKTLIEATNGLWGWFSLVEVTLFIVILAIGLVYAWAKGYLDWDKPEVKEPEIKTSVPESLYEKVNKKYS